MPGVSFSVLVTAGLLGMAVLAEPLASRLRLPLSLVLTVAGALLGQLLWQRLGHLPTALILPSEALISIFLPVLLFETAIEIDVRRLLEDIWPIMLLAVVAVIACTLVVGVTLAALSDYGLIASLLLASIISTTDPVAVVALFKDLSVPHRLSLLVEGESLFNDAAAIALFSVLLAMLVNSADSHAGLGSAALSFARSFTGGLFVGFAMAQLASHFLRLLPGKRMAEVTTTLVIAYLAFVAAEYGLHVSGVVAVVAATLVFAYDGRTRVSPETWFFLVSTWKQLGYWASALVFLLAAVRIPGFLADATAADAGLLVALVAAALLARALVLFGFMPALSALGIAQRVDVRLRLIILWGGLRGAISLALALAVLEHPGVPSEVKRLVATLVTAFVLFTLFVNGLSLRPLIRLLGLDRLASVDRFLHGRAIAHGIGAVHQRIRSTAQEYCIDTLTRERVTADYTQRLARAEATLATHQALGERDRLSAALITLTRREQRLCLRYYHERIVSGGIVRNLVAAAANYEDHAKLEGLAGYEQAVRSSLDFTRWFRLAVEIQHRFGWSFWLARSLAQRLESLLLARAITHELQSFNAARMPSMLGQDIAQVIEQVLVRRLHGVEDALESLRLQYGDFADTMQKRYLERAALRIEGEEYQRLFREAVINNEVFDDLERGLSERWKQASLQPALDLSLDVHAMLARVPLFNRLATDSLQAIAKLLRPHFVLPGETIIRAGDSGREMYFLVSGAVEVLLPAQAMRLGSGDFFGELALLKQAPRSADVTALGFCKLLVLSSSDLFALMARHPDIQAHIAATAAQRGVQR